MAKEGSNAWYRAYADRFYLDRANRDTYLKRDSAANIGISGNLGLPALATLDGVDLSVHAADLAAHTKEIGEILRTGEYIIRAGWGGYISTGTLTGNVLYTLFLLVSRNMTIDLIAIEVTATGTGTAARLGIYNNGTNLLPGTRLLDAGTVDITGTGVKAITISQALTKGIYHLAIVGDGTATLRAMTYPLSPLGIQPTNFSTVQNPWSKAFTYAALPTPFPTDAILTGGYTPFAIAVRVLSLD